MAHDLPFGLSGLAGLEAAAEAHPGLPPVERWNPAYCGDSGMRIARDGTWFHQGEPIRRPGLVRLFSTILRKDDEGFMLVTPAEKLSIAVEDAPFIAVLMASTGEGDDQRLAFTTNVGDDGGGRAGPCACGSCPIRKRRAGPLSACASRAGGEAGASGLLSFGRTAR